MKDQVELAESIARKAHAGKFRNDGVTPYITHPERVSKWFPDDLKAQAVAWLHDVIEDTEESAGSLMGAGIDRDVVEAVVALTKSEREDYDQYLIVVKANDLARRVKIQDMLDNFADSPSMRQVLKYARGLQILLEP